jgi:hypothetical protein
MWPPLINAITDLFAALERGIQHTHMPFAWYATCTDTSQLLVRNYIKRLAAHQSWSFMRVKMNGLVSILLPFCFAGSLPGSFYHHFRPSKPSKYIHSS